MLEKFEYLSIESFVGWWEKIDHSEIEKYHIIDQANWHGSFTDGSA